MSELLAIGVSHKTAPVEVRERLALPEARAADFVRDLRGTGEVHEAVVDLHLQPDRALPGRRRPGRGGEHGAGDAGQPGGDPPDRTRLGDLLTSQLRRRAPSLPGHRRA